MLSGPLERVGGLCISSLLLDSRMFVQDPQGSSDYDIDLPAVAEPAMVRVAVESGVRCAADFDTTSVAFAFGQRGEAPAVQRTQLPASHVEIVRDRYAKQGFSAEVVELLLGFRLENLVGLVFGKSVLEC